MSCSLKTLSALFLMISAISSEAYSQIRPRVQHSISTDVHLSQKKMKKKRSAATINRTELSIKAVSSYSINRYKKNVANHYLDFQIGLRHSGLPLSYGIYFSMPNIIDFTSNGHEAGVFAGYKTKIRPFSLFLGARGVLSKRRVLKSEDPSSGPIASEAFIFDGKPSVLFQTTLGYRLTREVEISFDYVQGTIGGRAKTSLHSEDHYQIKETKAAIGQKQFMFGVTLYGYN